MPDSIDPARPAAPAGLTAAPSAALRASLADRYRLERELGQGGMATVYLAEDLKHRRQVAIKVLRPELSALLGAERFLKEIETTANLQHPHILPLFDSGAFADREGGAELRPYYVMPYVAGESLRQRITRDGELPVAEAVRVARAVASALGAAHRRGIVHRDIKPENILLADGEPVVADFGIARAITASAGDRLTSTGLAVGTVAYMSPEQASADPRIDGRTDLYALGIVLYEMLAGEQPFRGRTAEAITARKLSEEAPSLHGVRPAVSEALEQVVRKALARTAGDRFQTAEEFVAALDQVFLSDSGTKRRMATAVPSRAARLVGPLAVLTAASLAYAGWVWLQQPPSPPVIRHLSAQAEGEGFIPGMDGMFLTISPDGRHLVYLGPPDTAPQLWLRDLSELHAKPIPGTRAGESPVFSPDGVQLAYLDGRRVRVSGLDGAPPVTVADSAWAISWSDDGNIYFTASRGILRVRPPGGTPELVLPYDSARGPVGRSWQEVLPGGRGILFRAPGNEITLGIPATGERRPVAKGIFARYAASGHLLIVTAEGTLLAAPFDLQRLALTGPAVPLIDSVGRKNQDYVDLAVSHTGRLVYLPSSATCAPTWGIPVWVERGGRETPVELGWAVGVAHGGGLALSPDGGTLAITLPDAAGQLCRVDIWLKKLPGGPMSRLTSPPGSSYHPFWFPDGKMVGFTSERTGLNRLWQRRSDGSGNVDSLLAMEGGGGIWGGSWSPDGAWLLASRNPPGGGVNVIALRPGRDSVPLEVVSSMFHPLAQTLSPDGKWLAYSSSETGRREIFVRPFPRVSSGKWQVSLDGGEYPRWSRQGSELFYSANRKWSTAEGSNEEFFGVARGDLMVARVRTSPTFEVIDRWVFVPELKDPGRYGYWWDYDVHPDGKRLLMVRMLLKENHAKSRLVVVENFFEELKAKVPR